MALGLTEEQCTAAVQYVDERHRLSGGAAVAAALCRCHQPYRVVGTVAGAPLLRPWVERIYGWVAEHRHRLPGGTPACASDRQARPAGGALGQGAGGTVAPARR